VKLQSIELRVPDVEATARFFADVWGLTRVSAHSSQIRLRGTDTLPWLVGLEAGEPAVRGLTFCGSREEVGGRAEVRGPEGELYRFIVEEQIAALPASRDRPMRLSHVVLNAKDVDAAERFATASLGLRVSDRTRHMTFLRCNSVHHCLAYARAGYTSLNHVAFEMADTDAVMRGIGRLRDAGYPCVWGPGRHGPGNNVFGYFVGPHGGIVEYTAEVSKVGEDYRVGGPEDWKWPSGRSDHWGVSVKDSARTDAAERAFTWPGRSAE
jgi:catechol 2,3-dioxygenase-like lactoylglutathione lyase family enzyme